ncbi:hypothetical protein GCM10007301_48130 [Azorhizobium oxalatiphilum]|uniref:Uncharacterized protein n=2 Tax=Azorhizobium oxalatiphilum TaxID=980631 RepID=A0A917CBF2_9HYPH|nr:hypothetical protein GCM10007301_48130 [Azorhizobium oxalatiphilum]
MPNTNPPRGAGKATAMTVAIAAVMLVAAVVGFGLNGADTLDDQSRGHVEQRDAPQTPTDLQRAPVQQ